MSVIQIQFDYVLSFLMDSHALLIDDEYMVYPSDNDENMITFELPNIDDNTVTIQKEQNKMVPYYTETNNFKFTTSKGEYLYISALNVSKFAY
jgi:hypothetical protein